jgi:hypothetical protein
MTCIVRLGPLRGAGSRQPEAPQQSPERAAAAPAPQLTMSLCFKIVFVAMVATIGAGAAQDAANSQPAQPAQDQESYSLPGREDFEDAAQGEEQGRDAPTLLASQSSDEYAGFGARRVEVLLQGTSMRTLVPGHR